MEGLPGYYDIAIDNKIVIYGPQQWFTPCNYNEDECHVRFYEMLFHSGSTMSSFAVMMPALVVACSTLLPLGP